MSVPGEQFDDFEIRHPERWSGFELTVGAESLDDPLRSQLEQKLGLNDISDAEGHVTTEIICRAAMLHWALNGEEDVTAYELWETARARPDYTRTIENEPGREIADVCIEKDALGLALRLLGRVAATVHEEPLDRRAHTASIMADILFIADDGLYEVFAGEADELWQAAQAAGQEVDDSLMAANKTYLPSPRRVTPIVRIDDVTDYL